MANQIDQKPAAGDADRNGRSAVLKFSIPQLLEASSEATVGGEFAWPIDPYALALLYRCSPEHGRSCQIKAETAFGGGLIGERASELDALTENGFAILATELGLDCETYGNAFLQIVRSQDGEKRPLLLRRLPAPTMRRFRDGYLQRIVQADGNIKRITFTAEEILHLRAPCPMGKRYAYPSWISAEGMLELVAGAVRYNAAFFKNNGLPEYAVIFKGAAPTKEQKSVIADFFRNEFQGIENAHRTLLLHTSEDAEIKFERLTADVKDADFLKLLDAARDRIPIAHGVPPRMLGIVAAGQLGGGGEVTGQLFIFEKLTLAPKRRLFMAQIRPVLDALGLKIGDPEAGLEKDEIAFKPLDLTPPDDDSEKLPALVQAGIMDIEEARALLPMLANFGGKAPLQKSAANAAGGASVAAAATDTLDALSALLARL